MGQRGGAELRIHAVAPLLESRCVNCALHDCSASVKACVSGGMAALQRCKIISCGFFEYGELRGAEGESLVAEGESLEGESLEGDNLVDECLKRSALAPGGP